MMNPGIIEAGTSYLSKYITNSASRYNIVRNIRFDDYDEFRHDIARSIIFDESRDNTTD
jgi:hypothetical protein